MYLRRDELHTAFNFDFMARPWDAARAARVDRRHARRACAGRRARDVGPLEPRRDAAGDPLRPGRHRRSRSRPSGSARRPISRSVAGGPAPRRCWRRPCPARSTSTRATSSGSTRSRTCPAHQLQDPMYLRSTARTPAATAAGCRCPGRGRRPPFGFSPDGARSEPWLRQPATLGPPDGRGRRSSDPRLDARALSRDAGHRDGGSPNSATGDLAWLPHNGRCAGLRAGPEFRVRHQPVDLLPPRCRWPAVC